MFRATHPHPDAARIARNLNRSAAYLMPAKRNTRTASRPAFARGSIGVRPPTKPNQNTSFPKWFWVRAYPSFRRKSGLDFRFFQVPMPKIRQPKTQFLTLRPRLDEQPILRGLRQHLAARLPALPRLKRAPEKPPAAPECLRLLRTSHVICHATTTPMRGNPKFIGNIDF